MALPALPASDGFDDFSDDGFAPIIVFDATKPPPYWRDRSGNTFDGEWLAKDLTEEIVFWNKDGLIDRTKTIPKQSGKQLPDVRELNEDLDRSLWRETQFGLQGPYQHQRVIHLHDPAKGAERRFISTSAGGAVCYRELAKSVQNMRRVHGRHVSPIVEPQFKKTPFSRGPQFIPHLQPVRWIEFGNGATALAIEHQPVNGNGGSQEEPPPHTGSDLDESIPW
jgi:hypothetical protein